MKYTRLIAPISIILSGIVTASMKVVTGVGDGFIIITEGIYFYETVNNNTVLYDGVEYPVLIYSNLPYLIGALLIFAGGLMLYNEIKGARPENQE